MSDKNQTIQPVEYASPFSIVLEPCKDDLPVAFREQFLLPVDALYEVVLEGSMDRIWHRPLWLRPFLWLLAWFDILFPETGVDVPASMIISGGRDEQQLPYHRWDRTFSFTKPRYFNAIMAFSPHARCVVERLGPRGSIEVRWHIHFRPPLTIEIISSDCYFKAGNRRIPLPAYPTVRAVETALDETLIHVDLTVSHPWLGDVFGYEGVFHLRRLYTASEATACG
jgi:hypothetical protein